MNPQAMTAPAMGAAPPPTVNALAAGQPAPANSGGDDATSGARIAALKPEDKAAAGRRAEILTAIGQGLAQRPYPERKAILAHMAPALAASGLPAQAVAGFDPTDANLAAALGQAAALRRALGGGNALA